MTDIQLTSDLVQTLKDIQGELQQLNKTLSSIAAKSKPASSETEGRYAGPKTGRPFRAEASDGPSTASRGPSNRFGAKKSPSRPGSKSAFPPKKGNGYPKKPR